jgi:hypothetical protein
MALLENAAFIDKPVSGIAVQFSSVQFNALQK